MRPRLTLADYAFLFGLFAYAAFPPVAIVGRHFFQFPGGTADSWPFVGWICLAIYGLVAIFNFCMSIIRPRLHDRRGQDDYQHVSGIPIVHSLFLVGAIAILPPSITAGMLMLVLLCLDTGAAHWAAFAFARDFLSERG